jgi:hypothetical protein
VCSLRIMMLEVGDCWGDVAVLPCNMRIFSFLEFVLFCLGLGGMFGVWNGRLKVCDRWWNK